MKRLGLLLGVFVLFAAVFLAAQSPISGLDARYILGDEVIFFVESGGFTEIVDPNLAVVYSIACEQECNIRYALEQGLAGKYSIRIDGTIVDTFAVREGSDSPVTTHAQPADYLLELITKNNRTYLIPTSADTYDEELDSYDLLSAVLIAPDGSRTTIFADVTLVVPELRIRTSSGGDIKYTESLGSIRAASVPDASRRELVLEDSAVERLHFTGLGNTSGKEIIISEQTTGALVTTIVDSSGLGQTVTEAFIKVRGHDAKYCTAYDVSKRDCRGSWEPVAGTDVRIISSYPVVALRETIDVLTLQSYPVRGGNWSVQFVTEGTADLRIEGINGTVFGEDIDLLDLWCGNTSVNVSRVDDAFVVEDYSCASVSMETSKVLTSGLHKIMFSFGSSVGYARNMADALAMEWGTITSLDATWQVVNLEHIYQTPVIVSTPYYTSAGVPTVTRITNVTANSFEIKLQMPGDASAPTTRDVHYMVVEAGQWQLPDGRYIEAWTYNSTTTDENGDWSPDARTYQNSYTTPVVLGQVMSTNDPDWSVFWASDGTTASPPDSSNLYMGKHVAEDTDVTRATELIGYVIIEEGHGTLNGVAYDAHMTGATIGGVLSSPPYASSYTSSFSSAPDVAIVSSSAMTGVNGGWVVQYTAPTTSQINLATDEDTIADTERAHANEYASVLAFETAGSYLENAYPKIEQALFDASVVEPMTLVEFNVSIYDDDGNNTLLYGLATVKWPNTSIENISLYQRSLTALRDSGNLAGSVQLAAEQIKEVGTFGYFQNVNTSWQRVTFDTPFETTPVVIHATEYSSSFDYGGGGGAGDLVCITRIKDVDTTGFSVRLDDWDNRASFDDPCPTGTSSGVHVQFIAMEVGDHYLSDGTTRVEVHNLSRGGGNECGHRTDYHKTQNNLDYNTPFSFTPYVFAAVQSAYDDDEINMYLKSCGSSVNVEYNQSCVQVGLNGLKPDAGDVCTAHTVNETVGVIIWGVDSSQTDSPDDGIMSNGSVTFFWSAVRSNDEVAGAENDPYPMGSYPTSYNSSFGTDVVAIANPIRIDGGDGLMPVLQRDTTNDQVYLLSMEDENSDDDQAHTAEPFTILVFNSNQGSIYSNSSEDFTNATSMWDTYTDVIVDMYETIENISVLVDVPEYNGSGSDYYGSGAPDLEIELYSGSGWISIGTLGVSGPGQYAITTTSNTIRAGWLASENRDVRIRGVEMDRFGVGLVDSISYDNITVQMEAGKLLGEWYYLFTQTDDVGIVNITQIYAADEHVINVTAYDDLYFEIEDQVAPVFTYISNITILNGTDIGVGFSAYDYSGISEWWLNTSLFSINGSGYLTNTSHRDVGFYGINISVNDTFGNTAWNAIFVNVTLIPDTTLPWFTPPPGTVQAIFAENFIYDVNATDDSGILDEFAINDTRFSINTVSGMIRNNSFLAVGQYEINVTINDTSGNENSTVMTVNVLDTTPPAFYSMTNATAEYLHPFSFDSSAYDDLAVDQYWINDSRFSIYNGIITNATSLAFTTYIVNVSVNDTTGNVNWRILKIEVNDTTGPGSVSNIDVVSSDFMWIMWNWSVPDTYDYAYVSLYLDGVWIANTTADFYNVTGLVPSTLYTLNISTTDLLGNVNTTEIFNRSTTRVNILPYLLSYDPEDQSANESFTRIFNVTVADEESSTLCVELFASRTGVMDYAAPLYQNCSVLNETGVLYNLTTLPFGVEAGTEVLWHFDNRGDETATFVIDHAYNVNNNRTCSTTCPTYTQAGKFGGAYQYDGSSDYWLLDEQYFNDPFTERSIAAWVKQDTITDIRQVYEEGGSTNGFGVRVNNGLLEFAVRAGTTSQRTITYSFTDTNDWHLIVAQFDGGNDNMTLYVDGIQVNSTSPGYGTIPSHGNDGALGASYGSNSFGDSTTDHYFLGSIDEVRISSTIFDANEISEMYNFTYGQTYFWEVNATDDYDSTSLGPFEFIIFNGDIIGNASQINQSSNLNVSVYVNSLPVNTTTDTYEDALLIELVNGTKLLSSFYHNFTIGPLDLRRISIIDNYPGLGVSVPNHNITIHVPLVDSVCNVIVCPLANNITECTYVYYEYPEVDGSFCNVTVEGTYAEDLPDETDALVNASTLSISPASPVEGENVTVYAEIFNNGTTMFKNITAQLWFTHNNTQLGSNFTLYNLTPNSSQVINASFIIDIATYPIEVIVDPPFGSGDYTETDETNNNFTMLVSQSPWHTYYGHISGNISLGNGADVAYSWIPANPKGNVYVTDSDSDVDWVSLLAIGRNTSGQQSSADFFELDAALGLAVEDNISSRFSTDGSQAYHTRNMSIYAHDVAHVPVMNSTVTSSFQTGLLWDASSDVDGEYSGSEDIVFVAGINVSQAGAYGTYDYEITVPATLRDQDPGESSLTFYVEII